MRSSWVVGLSVLTFAGCGTPETPRKDIVARVGNRRIDVRELSRSYALYPQWKRGDRAAQSYLTQLNALLEEKIYAQEAEYLGIDRDTLLTRYLEFLRQKELIKALYRRHVAANVRISEAEERRMYEWSRKSVDFEYLLTRDSVRSAALAAMFAHGGLAAIPSDSLIARGKKENARVGSVPPELEEPLFTGRLNEIRGPIRTPHGYFCIRITGGEMEKFLSEDEFARQRERIDKVLRDRKGDSLAAFYVYTVMKDKDLRLSGPEFWGAAQWFGRRVREARVDPMNIQSVYVTSDEIRILETDLSSAGDAVLATHRGGELTVRQFLSALASMPGSLRPRVRTPQQLKDAIGWIVRNQYLVKEAEREGLDADPEFLYEYALQRDETLAEAYYEQRRAASPPPGSGEQVFFGPSTLARARSARTDSLLRAELPLLRGKYRVEVDTARVRAIPSAPDAVLTEDPVRIFVREIFL